jgi:hypothetical protein
MGLGGWARKRVIVREQQAGRSPAPMDVRGRGATVKGLHAAPRCLAHLTYAVDYPCDTPLRISTCPELRASARGSASEAAKSMQHAGSSRHPQ